MIVEMNSFENIVLKRIIDRFFEETGILLPRAACHLWQHRWIVIDPLPIARREELLKHRLLLGLIGWNCSNWEGLLLISPSTDAPIRLPFRDNSKLVEFERTFWNCYEEEE